jgi:uncharacterized protein YbcC (UPF0753/DUF2309 family)
VIAKHSTVRHLVANRWLHLFRFNGADVEWLSDGCWRNWNTSVPADDAWSTGAAVSSRTG